MITIRHKTVTSEPRQIGDYKFILNKSSAIAEMACNVAQFEILSNCNQYDVIGPKATAFGDITQNNGQHTPFKVIQSRQFRYQFRPYPTSYVSIMAPSLISCIVSEMYRITRPIFVIDRGYLYITHLFGVNPNIYDGKFGLVVRSEVYFGILCQTLEDSSLSHWSSVEFEVDCGVAMCNAVTETLRICSGTALKVR